MPRKPKNQENRVRYPKKPCKKCGKIGERPGPLCRACKRAESPDYYGYTCHCGRPKDYTAKQCWECHAADGYTHRQTFWTPERVAFLRKNYPVHGGEWCAEKLGHPKNAVISKANHLGLTLNKAATRRIIHDRAATYMRANNPSKKPGAAERLAEKARKNLKAITALFAGHARIQREKPSGLERKLFAILDDLGVRYETHVQVKPKFIVDCKIGNLIIEADGDWWHGHPRFVPLSENQVKQQARDKARNAYLRKCGFSVERIWESDMRPETVRAILVKHRVINR